MSNHVFRKNRAVSPVIATVLIIALVIAAVAVVWLVVMLMLQLSDSLLAGYPSFSDENQNYFYDQITILITNSGTKNIVPKALLIQNSDSGIDLRWNFTVQSRTLIPGTGDEFHAQAVENVTELVGGINVDLYVAYTLDSSTGSEKEWTLTLGFYLPILVNASADIFQPLQYRTSTDDSSTSRGTFPGPGYSPHKWFILGRFIPGTSSSSANMQVDYIEASGYANETTYRPYLNSGDTFNTNIGTETNNSFVAYLDVGNQIGLIDFIGGSSSRFDRGDTLNWDSRGIVYAVTCINNPKSTSATVGIACQSDDDFYLWVNGELVIDSFADSLSWNEWSALKNITLTPGLNYILVKSGDRGGNWDVNLILVDIGDDDLETFTSVWPTSSPLLTKMNSKIMRTENTCETEEQKSIDNIYQNKIKLTNEYRCETYTIIGTIKQPFVYSLIRRDVLFYF
ncbi:MAG: hypothetical protein K9W46_11330 [Candidatus Heimdallarchaeum endolithica]|uniref:Type IV pilin n=1 Tax=Candidatus Heimdallarchaeum endolithica TaxID=2876572 RepID=A0A9Y1FNB4_9ARCH|nr:MAG: hypothetical protein K9W46_11330 [Candidatus Heimdallarchaeum endolithica]